MAEIKKRLIKSIFKRITDSLIKKEDGTYIFNNGTYHQSAQITLGSGYNETNLPTKDELCDYFEKEILSLIPHAVLFIYGDMAISVYINEDHELLNKTYRAKKEIDIYESLKTLFFPTVKESLVKFGNASPEWIYIPHKKYKVEVDESGGLKFVSHVFDKWRPIENAAIDFLVEDLNYHISTLKFRNPIPIDTIELPQEDITLEDLKSKSGNEKKGYYIHEFYSYNQKIKFLKDLFENFLEYYQYIVINNFPRIKNSFFIFSNLPLKISIYTKETVDPVSNAKNIWFTYTFEKLPPTSDNQVELFENQEITYDPEKHLICHATNFLHLHSISHFGNLLNTFDTGYFKYRHVAKKNALPFTYTFIKDELDGILKKVQSDEIFDEIKPYVSHVESWIQMILDAERRGGEDHNVELKRIPTESTNKDGSGNDLYSEINAFENGNGGYLFIGVDEDKPGLEKIVGLEGYFSEKGKNLDMVKREITDKCLKYLRKIYRIDADSFEGKTIIRIKVSPNYGNISWFKPEKGDLSVYIRENCRKRKLSPNEIETKYNKKS